jgi:hypothetical protein
MSLTAGVITQVSVSDQTAVLSATAASGGTGPYTQQWYRSTTSGFTPGGGNIISGATGLSLTDTSLVPNTIYYYKVVYTDTGASNVTVTATQLAVTTTPQVLNPNQFAESQLAGVVDLRFPYNSVSVMIDASQATALYAGFPVKMVDSAGGVPKVVGITAESDSVLGFINFDIKTVQFLAGMPAEISMAGNVMYLWSAGAIARGEQVTCNLLTPGAVNSSSGNTGDTIVGWAYDKATAAGQLIRVFLKTPSFTVV